MKKNNNESKLQKLVKKDKNFEFIQNGHQMLPTLQNFENYLKSKSYLRGLESQFDIAQYQDILVPHHQYKNYLFCKLTGIKLPAKKSIIMKHVNGKKFQRRLQQLKKQQEQEGDEEGQFQGVQIDSDQENESQKQIQQVKHNQEQKHKKTKLMDKKRQKIKNRNKNRKIKIKRIQNDLICILHL